MPTLGVTMIGRAGNMMFQYAHARAYAEQRGLTLQAQPWAGQRIFAIDDPPLCNPDEMLPVHYHQDQASLIYSRADCRRWFTFRPEIAEQLRSIPALTIAGHLRQGDYISSGYPVVSRTSLRNACQTLLGADPDEMVFVSEEEPFRHPAFYGDISWLPDFYRLMSAQFLFRSNSSFSWWAAVLSSGRVFSPVIEGLRGGMEHDNVLFVEGNWPRLADLSFVTDLHLTQ